MSKVRIIDFVEKNVYGAWTIWGVIGIRQYYGYTKAESVERYRKEALQTVVFNLEVRK